MNPPPPSLKTPFQATADYMRRWRQRRAAKLKAKKLLQSSDLTRKLGTTVAPNIKK